MARLNNTDNINAAALINNRPVAEPVRKGSKENTTADANAPRGYYAEAITINGTRYTARPVEGIAYATDEEWSAYDNAIAELANWYALTRTVSPLDHTADMRAAALHIMEAINRRAITTRRHKSADTTNAPRVDSLIEYAAADCGERTAPRGEMQKCAVECMVEVGTSEANANAYAAAMDEWNKANAAIADARAARKAARDARVKRDAAAALADAAAILRGMGLSPEQLAAMVTNA